MSCSKDDFWVYKHPKVDRQSIRTTKEGFAELLKTPLFLLYNFQEKKIIPLNLK